MSTPESDSGSAPRNEEKVPHPSLKPFKCPSCGSSYFSSIWKEGEPVGRYCKGHASGFDRSYLGCPGKHEELYDFTGYTGNWLR